MLLPATMVFARAWFRSIGGIRPRRLSVFCYRDTSSLSGALYSSPDELGRAIGGGDLEAGLILPNDFAERRARHESVNLQLLVDAVNANTATISGGYSPRITAN
jgi:hypothetical protein